MRKGLFYIVIAILSIGIIVFSTNNDLKYLICENPDNYLYTLDLVSQEEVTITVDTINNNDTFSEYVYHFEGSTLYIGVKFAMNPVNDNATSKHTFTIPLNDTIQKIILSGANNDKVIYPTS